MTHIPTRLVAILLLLSLISSVPLMTYNPTASSATPTLFREDADLYKWFYKRAITGTSYSYEAVRFNSASGSNIDKVTFATTTDHTVKAVSRGYTCAVLSDATAGAEKLIVAKFISTNDATAQDLITSTLISPASSAAGKTYEVADACTALKIDTAVYHFDGTAVSTTKFIADTLPAPAWVNPVFNNDFGIVAGDSAIYKYNTVSKTYQSVMTQTFLANKKVWTTATKIVVLSWAATADPNIKDYTLKAFVSSAATYELVGSIAGQSYDTVANAPPIISISDSLEKIVVYGKSNATTFFARAKTFDYTAKTSADLTLPQWMTDTQSAISISDNYVYARNIADKVGSNPPVRQHGAYLIMGTRFAPYSDVVALVGAQLTNWQKSIIYPTLSGDLYVLRQHVAANVVTIEEEIHAPTAQVCFSWDKKAGDLPTVLTGAGTAFYDQAGKVGWFLWAKVSATVNKFYSVYVNPAVATYDKITVSLSTTQTSTLKAVSTNFKCALIYDSATPALKTYNFQAAVSGTATLVDTIGSALYSGITLTDAATTFAVSDDCKGVRINNNIMHKFTDNVFYADTLPIGVSTLVNPVFTADFSLLVTDTAIHYYSGKAGAVAGFYTLDRNDTFLQNKKIWRTGNNYIVYSNNAINDTHKGWKIQFNSIANSLSNKLAQAVGTTFGDHVFLVSPKLGKVILRGVSPTNSSQQVYVGKSVDWGNKLVKDINFPTDITNVYTDIAMTDEFLYVKNSQGDNKQSVYIIMGGTLIQISNQQFTLPTTDYQRTIILPDQSQPPKLILAHQYNSGSFIRLLKDGKKSVGQNLNPNQVPPREMFFSKPNGFASFRRQDFPNFGKWMYTTSSGTILNYIEYDTTQPEKKKIITKQSLTGNNIIVATSINYDCAVTFVAGSALNVFKINSTAATISTPISAWAVVTAADQTSTQVAASASGENRIKVGNNCWAFTVENFVYLKNAGETAFTKMTVGSALSFAIFDKSLNFAYSAGKIYKFTTTDYAEILNVTGLKSTVELYASADLTKLMVLSFQQGAGTTYDAVVKFYYFTTVWNTFALSSSLSSFSTVKERPSVTFTPSFDTIGVSYLGGDSAAIKPIVIYAKADVTAAALTMYPIPTFFTGIGVTLTTVAFENHIFLLRLLKGVTTELFYKIDKVNLNLIEVGKRPLSADQVSRSKNGQLNEQSGNLVVLYDVEPSDTSVDIIKRLVGGADLNSALKGIDTRQSGLLIQNGQILSCLSGCSFCVNPTTCQECQSGYVLDSNNYCVRCGPLCATCAESDTATCLTCVNGHFLSGGACTKCHDSCITCLSTGSSGCTACKIGLYVQNSDPLGSGACSSCIDNCVSCNPTLAANPLCDTCKLGYVYHPTLLVCVKCIAGCTNCKYDKIYQCEKCGDGFEPVYNNASVLSQCKKCPTYCKTCVSGICKECRGGFRLTPNNTCVTPCRLPCRDCNVTDSTQCLSCIGGFLLNGTTCNPDLSCNTNKSCTRCVLGFNLIAGFCYQCNGGTNCRTCENMNIERCASCIKGFYLTPTSTCKACNITGCFACDTEATCAECKVGYTLSGPKGAAKCLKCSDSCASCFDSPTNCETCANGYTMSGWNCVNNNNIKLNLQLGGSFSQFSTSNYNDIEQAICDSISKDKSQVNVQEMRSSSIIISSSINVDNTAQQTTLMAALQTALATNSALAGFTIETSSLTAITAGTVYSSDSSAEVTKYKNIAIIVGVVIPVGLIILFIVFFMLYKKGIICADQSTTKIKDGSLQEMKIQNKESQFATMRQ